MEIELEPAIHNKSGLPVDKAVEWAKRARDYSLADDGENIFVLIFEIWNEAQSKVK